jgi:DNA-directed RNA polymerase subunit RPC12/RpoP
MFRRMFIGRNGPDQLSFALTILAFVLSFIPWYYIFVISFAIVAIAFFRMFSKDIEKRRKENLIFMSLVNKAKKWYYNTKVKRHQSKFYLVFKCPKCSQKLRVPRGKGKVSIKCSKCGHKFIKTT